MKRPDIIKELEDTMYHEVFIADEIEDLLNYIKHLEQNQVKEVSDEEIEKTARGWYLYNNQKAIFTEGAKWMRNMMSKILKLEDNQKGK